MHNIFRFVFNPFAVPTFISSFLLLYLGIFVYVKNRSSKLNILLSLVCFVSFVWLFGDSLMYLSSNDEQMAMFWMKIAYIGIIYIAVFFYHLTIEFMGRKKEHIVAYIAYAVSTLFVYLHIKNDFLIVGLRKYFWGYYPIASSTHIYFLIFFIGIVSLAVYYSFYGFIHRNALPSDKQKEQTKYVFLAFFIYSLACVDFLANYNISFYPIGYLFATSFLVIISYAIVCHQLMDIEIIIRKTLVFGGLFTITYAVFAFFAFLGQVFFEKYVTHNRWVSMIPSVLVVTLMLRPLENFLAAITDRYLFQKKYDYKKLLRTFTSEVLTILQLDKLISVTKDKLKEIMKIRSCDIVFEIASFPFLLSQESMGTRNDEGTLELPITMKGKDIGRLVLGRKKSDEGYNQEDLDILEPLAKTLGIAISNARLFNELSKARAEVAQKEKMAIIGTLAAGMAHEIRNPITTIRNFADYLPDKYNEPEFMEKFSKLIPKEIDRIEGIARSLLEFSSVEDTGKRERLSLDEPIKTVISILEPQHRASGIKVTCNARKGYFVKGSRVQLQDAFFQILSYVLAESQKGSSIVIECNIVGGELFLTIKNKGLFIGEHIIKDVFEPVSGLYKEKRGFGFNLFVAKQLLEKNAATLKISSDKIAGSEFGISFKSASGQP